jgi:hypothetical protein
LESRDIRVLLSRAVNAKRKSDRANISKACSATQMHSGFSTAGGISEACWR